MEDATSLEVISFHGLVKKQGTIALSIEEVEYVSTANYCTQLLWIRNQVQDYDVFETKLPIFYDNGVSISFSKNPIFHSRTKHIKIKYNFIRDYVQKGIVDLQNIPTKK